jgi:GTP-binding protein
MFIDEARITVKAGDGGKGSPSFHREKYKPKGGPDGGDGGRGGSVVLAADPSAATLSEFRRRRILRAPSGAPGQSNNRHGATGEDLVVHVPVGTVVHDLEADEMVADLAKPGALYIVARGGRGGRGNASIASGVERAPNFAEHGEPGEQRRLLLDLRIVADVGLIGPPNAGKSTLLRALSAARPKVADYPFTTLEPYLGVAAVDDERIVVADLPGLIEGAAEGRGLGTRFLRHAERCGVLAAVVDVSGDAVGDLQGVQDEVRAYEPELAERMRVVVGNKIDLEDADAADARRWAEGVGARFVPVSAMRGDGTADVLGVLVEEVAKARAERPEPESFAVFRPVAADRLVVEKEGTGFRVRSTRVERLVGQTPLQNPRAVRHLQRRLNAMGVEAALRKAGAGEGDEVYIGGATFEYHPEP